MNTVLQYTKYNEETHHWLTMIVVMLFYNQKAFLCYVKLTLKSMRVFLFSVSVLVLTIASCSKNKKEFAKPQVNDITHAVYASGIIKAEKQYQAFANAAGTIQDILVAEGDSVNKGTPILLIANDASKINEANAALAARFNSEEANKSKLEELRINIQFAEQKMKTDSLMYKRQQNLYKQQIGSLAELEQKQITYENSKTLWKAAQLRLADTERQIRFAASQANNNLQISKTQANEFILRSLIDGKLYSLPKKRGEMINAQTPLAIIGHASAFLIEMQVDEYDIVKIKNGQQVFVSLDSYKGQVFEAKVTRIVPIMNERTKTFTIEAVFLNPPTVLYPNLTVECNIIIEQRKGVLTLDRKYITNDNHVVLTTGERKAVTLGIVGLQSAEIISGINANDEVVLP